MTLPSGLVYKEIVEGQGPSPIPGFQVVVNYVAMTPELRIFDNSLEKGKPYGAAPAPTRAPAPATRVCLNIACLWP